MDRVMMNERWFSCIVIYHNADRNLFPNKLNVYICLKMCTIFLSLSLSPSRSSHSFILFDNNHKKPERKANLSMKRCY